MSQAVKETYRRIVNLRDGSRLLLRPLVANDVDALLSLYATATPEDMLLLNQDFSEESTVRACASALDYDQAVPLLALIDHKPIGHATLERRQGHYCHVGDVYVYLTPEYRNQGIGTLMFDTLVELARKNGLHWLQAEVFSSQTRVMRALEGLGFERQCLLDGFFMRPDGRTEDITILRMRLDNHTDAF